MELAPPFNFCDSQCGRCPLRAECAVHRRFEQRRWVHEARGADPDSPEAVAEDVMVELERAERLVEQAAQPLGQPLGQEDGIDLDAPVPPPEVPSIAVRRVGALRGAGIALAIAARDAVVDLPEPLARRAVHAATTIAIKLGRFTHFAEYPSDDHFEFDVAPNLLLVEHMRRELESVLPSIREPAPLAAALERVVGLIGAWTTRIEPGLRAAFEARVAAGEAPSPFCVLPD